MNETTRRLLREIRNDNRSGASEIAKKAADCLIDFVENFVGETQQDFLRELHGVGRDVIMAQPAMAPLFNLVNSVFLSAEEVEGLEGCKICVKERARAFVTTLERGWEAMAEATSPLVQKSSRILAHSYSATLCRVLLALHERGIGFSVTCTESRPLLEGVTLARRLVDKGIPVRLIVDSAAFQVLHSVDLLLVGADTISPLGVTNKIGTCGLAMAAQSLDVPVYVLAGSEKLLPLDSQVDLEEERKPADEVLERAEPIEVLNVYFDRTPLQLVSGVITERGVLETGVLKKQLESLTIHPFLVDCLKERQ